MTIIHNTITKWSTLNYWLRSPVDIKSIFTGAIVKANYTYNKLELGWGQP